MAVVQITPDHTPADLDGKHIVVNCRTGELYACDSHDEADALAAEHDRETADALAAEQERAAAPPSPPGA